MGIKSITGAAAGAGRLNKTAATNPFKHNTFKENSFKNNSLPFADVFQAIKPVEEAKPGKMEMLAKTALEIKEKVVGFAADIKEKVSSGIKNAGETLNNAKNKVSRIFDFNNKTDDTKKVLSMKEINNKASVEDLRAAWVAENAAVDADRTGKAVA